MFEGMSDDEEDFQSVSLTRRCIRQVEQQAKPEVTFFMCLCQGSPAGAPNRMMGSAGMRPVSLGHSGATGPRPITQSELATALALASTPESSAVTPTTSTQVRLCETERADESFDGTKALAGVTH